MLQAKAFAVPLLLGLLGSMAAAQSADGGTEGRPKLTTYKCTTAGGCVAQQTAVVIEASQHNIHRANDPKTSCGPGDAAPDKAVCPDAATCQKNCVIESIPDYAARGVVAKGSSLTLRQLSAAGDKLSPRVYLLNAAEDAYEMLRLTGQEFAFDVDMSKLPCGMNSALYLSEMDPKGGQSQTKLPVAGPRHGTGYCDAQCFVSTFLNGLGNLKGFGACCNELDIWEANSRATHLAPHTCNQTGLFACDPATGACGGDGVCDKAGCSMNPYKLGNPDFYGRGKTVDTTRKFTVVTQFVADASGDRELVSMKRLYVQGGRVIEMPAANVAGVPKQNFLDDKYCTATGATKYLGLGGTAGMGEAMRRGMVLAFSLWWDPSTYMAWLDQTSTGAGPCGPAEGMPSFIQTIQPDAQVTFSEVRWGDIGSTFAGATNRSTSAAPPPAEPSPAPSQGRRRFF